MNSFLHSHLRVRTSRVGLIALALVWVLPLCAACADPVKFAAMSELTGPGAENGEQCRLGYQIAEELFRASFPNKAADVELLYGDHKREQKAGISEFQRFAHAGVWGVAANHGLIGAVINPLSKQAGIPLFGVMGHENFVRVNPFAMRAIPTPEEEGGGLARQALADGKRRLAILLLEDDYILAVGRAFESAFIAGGGEVVYKDYFVEATSDFSAIASKIRVANPDALAMTLGFQQFGPAIKRLREQQISQPIYANYWLSYPSVIAAAGGPLNVQGSTYITERSNYPKFLSTYERLAKPSSFRSGVVFRCYTALAAALFSYAQCPSCKSREEYSRYVANVTEVALPDGELHVRGREIKFEVQLYRMEGDGLGVLIH